MRDHCGRNAGASSAVALGSGALALFAPKCPACIAVWLSGLGFGASLAADVAPHLMPLTYVLLTGASLAALVYLARLVQKRATC